MVISGFTALTLTPALCAIILHPGDHESKLFKPFNVSFAWLTRRFPRNCFTSHNVLGQGPELSGLAIDLLAVFIFRTQIGFPVAIRFGHVSRSPVIVLPTNGIDIFTSTEEAAK